MRLIDADALKDSIKKNCGVYFDGTYNNRRICSLIDNAPTVHDTVNLYLNGEIIIQQTRSQGKWIEQGYLEYKCSVCGRHISLEDHWTNITKDYPFCHCGADMRKVEDEISDPVISAIQENNAKYDERPNIDFSRISYDLGESNKPNCVTCDHFGKCDGCEKREEE